MVYVYPKILPIYNAKFFKGLKIRHKIQLMNSIHNYTDTQKNKMAIRFL